MSIQQLLELPRASPPSPKHTRHSARAFLRLSVVNAVNWSRANFSSERSAQPSDIVLIAGDSWSSLDERPAAPCTRVTASKQQLEDLSSAAKREGREKDGDFLRGKWGLAELRPPILLLLPRARDVPSNLQTSFFCSLLIPLGSWSASCKLLSTELTPIRLPVGAIVRHTCSLIGCPNLGWELEGNSEPRWLNLLFASALALLPGACRALLGHVPSGSVRDGAHGHHPTCMPGSDPEA